MSKSIQIICQPSPIITHTQHKHNGKRILAAMLTLKCNKTTFSLNHDSHAYYGNLVVVVVVVGGAIPCVSFVYESRTVNNLLN
jgi:hypothetical protein